MAKTNLTKVEGILEAGIQKMKAESLLEQADVAQGKTKKKEKSPKAQIQMVEKELIWIYGKDPQVFKNLHLKKKKLKTLFEKPEEATEEDLAYIHEVRELLARYKKEKLPNLTDEDLVKKEQDRHINKRHNVNEKWLPL